MLSFYPAHEKRKKFIKDLKSQAILRFVGSFSPLVSRLIEEAGFEGLYISGAVLSSDLALPDLELISLSDVTHRGGACVRNSPLPSLVDVDTGFGSGSPLNITHTVQELEHAGFCGLHLEDQKSPKRCGHLDNKKLISISEMQDKIKAAVQAKSDPNFLIVARTDARGVMGLDEAITRAQAYKVAGAEAIFPEALIQQQEFEKFRQAIDLPLIANMTEFGKSDLIPSRELEKLGYNMVLYPVTTWRLALKAVQQGLKELSKENQKQLLDKMLTRKKLYELLKYVEYEKYLNKA